MSFFGPFWADYWVLERAEDYSWTIVGEPEGRYLWLLTRARDHHARCSAAISKAASLRFGYRPAELVWAAPPTAETASR